MNKKKEKEREGEGEGEKERKSAQEDAEPIQSLVYFKICLLLRHSSRKHQPSSTFY